jgi:Astacin (Peptidase family M12A)
MQQYITDAIADFTAKTCVRFVPHSGQKDYIAITDLNTNSCSSYVGCIKKGKQLVLLAIPGCFQVHPAHFICE